MHPSGGRSGRREALKAQQFEPVWMGLTRQQLLGRLADPLSAATAHENAVVQEELQQAQVGIAQMASQEEVPAQPRVQVLHHRTRARRVGVEQAVVSPAAISITVAPVERSY